MVVMGLPHGRTLVTTFGQGTEESNLEAITTWVEAHLNEIDPVETIRRLEHRLQGIPSKNETETRCNGI